MDPSEEEDPRKTCYRCGGDGHTSPHCRWPADERDLPPPDLRLPEADEEEDPA